MNDKTHYTFKNGDLNQISRYTKGTFDSQNHVST